MVIPITPVPVGPGGVFGIPAKAVLPGAPVALASLPPLSLYVHIPWCLKKCPYCDFNSHELRGEAPEKDYVALLVRDLEQSLPQVWGRRVYSVFFGGGTPSVFSAESIAELMSAFRSRLTIAPDAEVTLEANPGTFEAAKFRAFRDAGINRLSVGIQSFDAARLAAIGRVHDGDEARRAARIAVETFERVNLDLMYALPGQDLDGVLHDVREALGYGSSHLSLYHLTLEPNTLFHRHPPALPDDDAAAAMQQAISDKLGAAGFEHYETSAHARPGQACRHNLNYWRFGDYLGIGAGAHGKVSFPDRIERQVRARHPAEYAKKVEAGDALVERRDVAAADRVFEFMMNALRLTEGFEIATFTERTGLPITAAMRAMQAAEARGLLARDHVRVWPTELGRRFLNDLLELFLP